MKFLADRSLDEILGHHLVGLPANYSTSFFPTDTSFIISKNGFMIGESKSKPCAFAVSPIFNPTYLSVNDSAA
jgi:hypothetical protein